MREHVPYSHPRPLFKVVLAASAIAAMLLVAGLAPAAQSRSASAPTVSGEARVIDGDTLAIGDVKVRLEGIDAPETGQTCGRKWFGVWSCGSAATDTLKALTAGHVVHCQSAGEDKYQRLLGRCTAHGVDINAEMVRRGMAWAFLKYSRSYVEVEAEARALRIGVWQGDAQPPWEYRTSRWEAEGATAPGGCAIKGNVTRNGRIYHMPWSPWYGLVRLDTKRGERWFCSEQEAIAAGWRAAGR
jgi:endonuclease YncB( thermonuclease family)